MGTSDKYSGVVRSVRHGPDSVHASPNLVLLIGVTDTVSRSRLCGAKFTYRERKMSTKCFIRRSSYTRIFVIHMVGRASLPPTLLPAVRDKLQGSAGELHQSLKEGGDNARSAARLSLFACAPFRGACAQNKLFAAVTFHQVHKNYWTFSLNSGHTTFQAGFSSIRPWVRLRCPPLEHATFSRFDNP